MDRPASDRLFHRRFSSAAPSPRTGCTAAGTAPDSDCCLTEVMSTSPESTEDTGNERAAGAESQRSGCWRDTGSKSKSVREMVRTTDTGSPARESGTVRGTEVAGLLGTWEEEAR